MIVPLDEQVHLLSRVSLYVEVSPMSNSAAHVLELTQELFRQAAAVAAGVSASTGLHATDLHALRALDAAAGSSVTVSALGSQLGLSSGAVTALVDRLERSGLVQRERDAVDRRRVHVVLTPQAHAIGGELLVPLARRMQAAVAAMSPAELAAVASYLAAVTGVEPRGGPPDASASPRVHPGGAPSGA